MAGKKHTDGSGAHNGDALALIDAVRSTLLDDVQASLAGAIGILDGLEDDALFAHDLNHALNLLRRAAKSVELVDERLDRFELATVASDAE